MKKYLALFTAVVLTLCLLVGCSTGNPDSSDSSVPQSGEHNHPKADVNITAIAGPTGVGLVHLMKNQDEGKAENNYTFNVVSAPDQAVAAITNGSADIAAVPTNLASTLYKKTGGKVTVLAVNTLGVLHILANGEQITKVSDLKGKTIFTSGKGANPEYILKFVLERNGLDPEKDVKIEYVADNDALATLVINGTAKIAMVPEPKASAVLLQNKNVKRVLNMTDEWQKKDGKFVPVSEQEGTLMMGCVVARAEFVEKNPDAVAHFMKEYEASINAVNDDVATAATLCEQYKIIPKAAIAKMAIPNCELVFISGKIMKRELSTYLEILHKYNPAAIGGELPKNSFYYVG